MNQETQASLLPESETCQVFNGDELIFTSRSHWLHPLFELKGFLESHTTLSCPPARDGLFLRDRVIGRAAALMIVEMNILRCAAPVVSERALPVFRLFSVACDYDELVPRLPCRTEDILADITDPGEAWDILEQRARAAKEAKR